MLGDGGAGAKVVPGFLKLRQDVRGSAKQKGKDGQSSDGGGQSSKNWRVVERGQSQQHDAQGLQSDGQGHPGDGEGPAAFERGDDREQKDAAELGVGVSIAEGGHGKGHGQEAHPKKGLLDFSAKLEARETPEANAQRSCGAAAPEDFTQSKGQEMERAVKNGKVRQVIHAGRPDVEVLARPPSTSSHVVAVDRDGVFVRVAGNEHANRQHGNHPQKHSPDEREAPVPGPKRSFFWRRVKHPLDTIRLPKTVKPLWLQRIEQRPLAAGLLFPGRLVSRRIGGGGRGSRSGIGRRSGHWLGGRLRWRRSGGLGD